MERDFNRLVSLVEKRRSSFSTNGSSPPFALRTRNGPLHVFGSGEPAFTLVLNDRNAISALTTMDKTTIAEAYMAGALDVEGDLTRVLSMRSMFDDRHPLRFAWRFVQPLVFGQVQRDKNWIAEHYDYEEDFYLLFLDRRHRCYSQAVFAHDDEPLEDAMTRKMEFAVDSIGAKPGDRVLDIGGGWGAFTEFGGKRGLHVTSLTISKESERFLTRLIAREGLPCRVLREHLFEHQPAEKYDHIVNLGVTEHLPRYPETLEKYRTLLKPGGKIYLDASASRKKNDHSTFLERYVFPGNGSLLCLHEYLEAVAETPFQVEVVHNDRHNYGLTCRYWAENLDRNRKEIERRWGKQLHRKFQLYLWGCAEGFQRDMIQAYRWVMRLPE